MRCGLAAVAVAAATLIGTAAPLAAARAAEADVGIARVTVTDASVTVTGTAGTAAVDVYALDPTAGAAAWPGATPVASAVPVAGRFSVTVPRRDGELDRYWDEFLAVSDGTVLGGPHLPDDVQLHAANPQPYPQVADKKGVQVEMTDDAELLGVRHAAVNVAFNQLMLLRDENPPATITFTDQGRTYFFDRAYVEGLDRQVKPLSDAGALVNLILILYRDTRANSAFARLVHPDAAIGAGTVYAFDTKTAEGLGYFRAAMRFLTERYTRTDQRYGRALGYIVGNELNSAYVWQNMGDQPLAAFLTYYERAMRVAWQAAREADAAARVYVSLDHEWTVAYDPGKPQEYYPGRAVLDGLAALTRTQGDFPWAVAYHPYPQDLTNPAFWHDTQATPSFDSPLITFKNIEQLPAYLQQPALTFQGAQRRIILSEQGCNTPDDSLAAQQLQAACYAYAYYKVRFLDGIDAFVLHRHVDHQAEGGLHLGLWTWDPARADYSLPGEHKYVYDVFRDIDTARSLQATRFALPIIGIRDWSDVIPGFDPAALDQRDPPQEVGTQLGVRPVRGRPMPAGWTVADNADAVDTTDGVVHVHFDANLPSWSTDAKTYKGTQVTFADPLDARSRPHLALAVRVPSAPAAASARVTVYGRDGSVAFGIAPLPADGTWDRLALDLSRWRGRSAITRVKVWVRAAGDADWKGTFDLAGVSLAPVTTRGGPRNLQLTAATTSRHGPGGTLRLTVTDDDAQDLTGGLTVVPCDGVSADPATVRLPRVQRAGGTATVSTTVSGYAPADPDHPRVCASIAGQPLLADLTLPPPTVTPLYDFEAGPDGWQPGANVSAVTTVATMPDGPGHPHGGTGALDATASVGDASAWKTVTVAPTAALDLSAARSLVAWVDAYGGAPGASGDEAEIVVHSDDQQLAATVPVHNDTWNQVALDLSAWRYRNHVNRIEIRFRAVGTTATWAPHFQVDDVGWSD